MGRVSIAAREVYTDSEVDLTATHDVVQERVYACGLCVCVCVCVWGGGGGDACVCVCVVNEEEREEPVGRRM